MKKLFLATFLVLNLYGCGSQQTEPPLENRGESIQTSIKTNEKKSTTANLKYNKEGNPSYQKKFIVKGYSIVQERYNDSFEGSGATSKVVFFNVLNTGDSLLNDFFESHQGNAFVEDRSISLGCIRKEALRRTHSSAEFGMKSYENSPEVLKRILSSAPENPITIELERYSPADGRGAPTCYSHFAEVNILD